MHKTVILGSFKASLIRPVFSGDGFTYHMACRLKRNIVVVDGKKDRLAGFALDDECIETGFPQIGNRNFRRTWIPPRSLSAAT